MAEQLQQQDGAQQRNAGQLPCAGVGDDDCEQQIDDDGRDDDDVVLEDACHKVTACQRCDDEGKQRECYHGHLHQVDEGIPAEPLAHNACPHKTGGSEDAECRTDGITDGNGPCHAGHPPTVDERVNEEARCDADGETLLQRSHNQGEQGGDNAGGQCHRCISALDAVIQEQHQQIARTGPQVVGRARNGSQVHLERIGHQQPNDAKGNDEIGHIEPFLAK